VLAASSNARSGWCSSPNSTPNGAFGVPTCLQCTGVCVAVGVAVNPTGVNTATGQLSLNNDGTCVCNVPTVPTSSSTVTEKPTTDMTTTTQKPTSCTSGQTCPLSNGRGWCSDGVCAPGGQDATVAPQSCLFVGVGGSATNGVSGKVSAMCECTTTTTTVMPTDKTTPTTTTPHGDTPTTTTTQPPVCNADACRVSVTGGGLLTSNNAYTVSVASDCKTPFVFTPNTDNKCCGVCRGQPAPACTATTTKNCAVCPCVNGVVGTCTPDPACAQGNPGGNNSGGGTTTTTHTVKVTVTVDGTMPSVTATAALVNDVLSACAAKQTVCTATITPVGDKGNTYQVTATVTTTGDANGTASSSSTSDTDLVKALSSNPIVQSAQISTTPIAGTPVNAAVAVSISSVLVALSLVLLAMF